MDRVNSFSNQIYLSVDREDDEPKLNTKKSRSKKSRNQPGQIHTLRYRNNLKEKLDDRHEQQLQMQNRCEDQEHCLKSFEHHADRIVSKMGEDPDLMENSVESEKLRKDVLKNMPQCLTIKRCIKKKLAKSVNTKGKSHPISNFKRLQYRMSMKYWQIRTKLKDLTSSYELWYSSLKTIEGQFGSATSSYFKFLRWLLIINTIVMAMTLSFIVIPQLTFENPRAIQEQRQFSVLDIFTGEESSSNCSAISFEDISYFNISYCGEKSHDIVAKGLKYDSTRCISDYHSLEGFLTDTLLYYGYYSNETVNIHGFAYNMPYAFFYTMLFLYVFTFLVLSYGVAVSYRKSFIETEGGLRNIFANKILCGWDFGIATQEAADLKSRAIFNELKEFLSELNIDSENMSLMRRIKWKLIHLATNVIILVLFVAIGYFLWFLLEKHAEHKIGPIVIAVTANVFNVVVPILFTRISRYENYRNQKNAIGITLIRSFILSTVIVGTLVIFWLIHSFTQECWETSLGQEMYRLFIYDFLLSLLIHAINLIHHFVNRLKCCKISPNDEFDVASNTLDLIYSQSLFWMGFFFSPLLSVVVTVRMFLTWYLKKYYVLKLCKPSTKAWRASQTQTWFLTLTFLTLLATGGTILLILLRIPATKCGPFQGHAYIYQVILPQFEKSPFIPFKLVGYSMKPGVISLIIIALCARLYYVREKANAQRKMVKMLRNMLVWESKDKEFLLKNIAKITEGEFQYVQESRLDDPYLTMPKIGGGEYSDSGNREVPSSSNELIASSKFGS